VLLGMMGDEQMVDIVASWLWVFMHVVVGFVLLFETLGARQTRGLAPFNPYRVYVSQSTVMWSAILVIGDVLYWFSP